MPVKPSEMDLNDAPAKASELFLSTATRGVPGACRVAEELATTYGFPTNALFGFASMLMKLLADYVPRRVSSPGTSGRGAGSS